MCACARVSCCKQFCNMPVGGSFTHKHTRARMQAYTRERTRSNDRYKCLAGAKAGTHTRDKFVYANKPACCYSVGQQRAVMNVNICVLYAGFAVRPMWDTLSGWYLCGHSQMHNGTLANVSFERLYSKSCVCVCSFAANGYGRSRSIVRMNTCSRR